MKYETTKNAGHSHTISDPKSGYTDVTNGHRHKLSTGCSRCNKIRKKLFGGKTLTSFHRGHSHLIAGELVE